MPLTLERIKQLEHELDIIDMELDSIIQDYYSVPGAQNIAGNIGELSRTHALLVELLATKKRELMEKK
jgi:hypothetical protein